jgi:hypothetical protein
MKTFSVREASVKMAGSGSRAEDKIRDRYYLGWETVGEIDSLRNSITPLLHYATRTSGSIFL